MIQSTIPDKVTRKPKMPLRVSSNHLVIPVTVIIQSMNAFAVFPKKYIETIKRMQ